MIKKLFASTAVITLLLQLVFLLPVHAEAPHCFIRSLVGDAAFQKADCSSMAALISAYDPGGPHDDKCYAESGSLGGTLPSVDVQALSSPVCQQWIKDAGVTAAAPPICAAIDGKQADWDDHKIKELSQIHPNQKCSDYTDRVKASGIPQEFKNGNCYLLFKESDTVYTARQYECKVGLDALIAGNKAANTSSAGGVTDADRETVVHCGEHPGETVQTCLAANPLVQTAELAMNFLSAGVGIIVVVMIMIGGLQYLGAGNNPQAVAAGKKKITNALIALVAFMLLYAFMQWLLPGGPF